MAPPDQPAKASEADKAQAAPSISLPKGGGAVRGIGEKFAANPVTGTGSTSIPIAASPGRSGFGPQLSLSYDSGSGNGPFGFGWSLALPSIARKTDKALPLYLDAEESDVFILSGSEDLVPVLEADGSRHRDLTSAAGYAIERYRPRIEGIFARIERWTRLADKDVHWRSISKDNVLTLYGQAPESRIADPADPRRIFSWLISETRDDKANAILYGYKSEDGAGCGLTRTCERNRGRRDDVGRTANRYLKRIRYGNRHPLLDAVGLRPRFIEDLPAGQRPDDGWMFELVLDYGEHDVDAPTPDDSDSWTYRDDPFSSYRAGFEVRTTRLCRRVLMFHHIPQSDAGAAYDGVVRSTDLTYSHQQAPADPRNPVYTFLRAVTQSGWRALPAGGYERRSLPPVEFDYSEPIVQNVVESVDPRSLENLPAGMDGVVHRWTDLHGEGIPGILAEQAGAFFYKRNLSPIADGTVALGPMQCVAEKPNLTLSGGAQFMDLAGDGRPDLVALEGPTPGFYQHDGAKGWEPFRPLESRLNRDMRDPNLRFVDLNGDARADVLITEDDAFVWHPSLGEAGFGPARRVAWAADEEKGPRQVFADATQSIHLADLSGDGLSDLVRIRNGEICYWPNLGYGRFGAKVSMDHAPCFDHPDQFDQNSLRLADIDGSGTTDLVYLHREGVHLYFNQSGNGWSEAQRLDVRPRVDDLVSIEVADLLGNGTACLVWSSALPADAGRPMRYVSLMGSRKPHLLVRTVNNLGAETRIDYAPSTKFYLQDERDGRPWLTRLPFPVHVVERVETIDHIARNRFVARYAYHHGYFDRLDREFRGFGMVEQWDTESLAVLTPDAVLPISTNLDPASHLPPVLTRTWFHTGIHFGRGHVSDFFAGLLDGQDKGEYYREPGNDDQAARALLLPDTVLPAGLTVEEEREACRALKGSMLRQEVYALDGSAKEPHPYTVVEQNFTVRKEQPRGGNRHAVFLIHAREALTYHYERDPTDPRVQHALTLEVDAFGNVLKEASIGYGRRVADASLPLDADRARQTTLITFGEHGFTNAIDDTASYPDDYRAPLPCEARTWELTGYGPAGSGGRFRAADFVAIAGNAVSHLFDSEIAYEETPSADRQRRLIEHVRTLYRADDLSALSTLGVAGRLALAGESYKLAFTPGLLNQVFQRGGQALLPNPAAILGGQDGDRGGYLSSQELKADLRFPSSDPDDHWWIPSGLVFLSPAGDDDAAEELSYARDHFFLPRRMRSPFHAATHDTESFIGYDGFDLLPRETRDALGNRVTVGERKPDGSMDPAVPGNDYRILQPILVSDPNRNRAAVSFDALGMVVGTAMMGKPEENLGDSLTGFVPDLAEAVIVAHIADPLADPHGLLGGATTRLVYDLFAYHRTRNLAAPQASAVCVMARETHDADLQVGQAGRIQLSLIYSDGFGREIQKKIQAEPGPLSSGGAAVMPRWVGSGWTIFNNKGKPVRQYEPFFSGTPAFEFGVQTGVSPILFYDPLGRAVATLHPDHSYDKMVFGPWCQINWDRNDTMLGLPRTDPDIAGFVGGHFTALDSVAGPSWQSWLAQRQGGALGQWEEKASEKAEAHAGTPMRAYFDTLGRTFLTIEDNGPDPADPNEPKAHLLYATRVERDIEGNKRAVRDAVVQGSDLEGRIAMLYAYDMLGNCIRQSSADAGERWMLADAVGNPIRSWDSRSHAFRNEHDRLRRPLRSVAAGVDPSNPARELVTERLVYGEQHPQAEARNLRGKLWFHLDQTGAATTEANDFKGNSLEAARRLTAGTRYRETMDWAAVDSNPLALPADQSTPIDPVALEAALAPHLEDDTYVSNTAYDALNRPVALTTPATPAMDPSTIRPRYNEANLLDRVDVNLRGETAAGLPTWTPFISNIEYDAKGQRLRIDYGNDTSTHYDYDPLTYRLARLLTRRNPVTFPDDCPSLPATDWPGCQVQDLRYAYDPIGNITHIEDRAQQAIFFGGRRVDPSADYVYDPLYRLIEAAGREHLGQGGDPVPHSPNDTPRRNLPHPGDGLAMGTYLESYIYDAVGNLLAMKHAGTNPVKSGWTRAYTYAEPSLLEPGKTGNRLTGTTVGTANDAYLHDPHGNIIAMPHLSLMQWDAQDRLQATARQQVSVGTAETSWYVYDAAGQRVRKVTERAASGQSPTRKSERIYLGGFEIYRSYAADGETVILERETLHIMDDVRRLALVENRTKGNEPAPVQLIRYQLAGHTGYSSVELDDQAHIISYEEYSPYGATSYQAVRAQIEAKRYRFSGKERDGESGFDYFGERYYAPWLARWLAVDPLLEERPTWTPYVYARNNPVVNVDPNGAQDHGLDDDHDETGEKADETRPKKPHKGKNNIEYDRPRDRVNTWIARQRDKEFAKKFDTWDAGDDVYIIRKYYDHEVKSKIKAGEPINSLVDAEAISHKDFHDATKDYVHGEGTKRSHKHYDVKYGAIGGIDDDPPDPPIRPHEDKKEHRKHQKSHHKARYAKKTHKHRSKRWGWAFYLGASGTKGPIKHGFTLIEWSIGNPDYGFFGQERKHALGHGGFHSTGGWKKKAAQIRPKYGERRRPTGNKMHYFGMFMWLNKQQVRMINANLKRTP
ncbi:MAG TPA: SpvB/TcaC N-terminal domain-containing protein [Allosphingosinicella sp.]